MVSIKDRKLVNSLRAQWKANDDLRDRDFSIPESVKLYDDISYGPFKKDNLLSVFVPDLKKEKYPCIVVFHGGGFFYGTKETYRIYSADLARRGFAVVTFNYRLSPEHKFPCPVIDADNALKWVLANAAEYCIDTENIFFAGDSAGAFLALDYAAVVKNPEFSSLYKINAPEINLKGIALNCGEYDLLGKRDGDLGKMAENFIGRRTSKKEKMLSVNNFIGSNFPSVYIMSAPNDFLLYQMQPQVDFFKSKGIFVTEHIYGTAEDPFSVHVFHLNLHLDIARECNDQECDFFKSLCNNY